MGLNFFRSACFLTGVTCCFLMGAAGALGQSEKHEAADVTALRAEVQRLALDLLRHRAEFIQWKMQWMRAELQQVQAERHRLSSERQLIEREIGELNQASTNGPGTEDEDRKEELNKVQVPALLAGERTVIAREAALAAALNAESARVSEIQEQMQRLAAHPLKHK